MMLNNLFKHKFDYKRTFIMCKRLSFGFLLKIKRDLNIIIKKFGFYKRGKKIKSIYLIIFCFIQSIGFLLRLTGRLAVQVINLMV